MTQFTYTNKNVLLMTGIVFSAFLATHEQLLFFERPVAVRLIQFEI
jgi:hypothetical protein